MSDQPKVYLTRKRQQDEENECNLKQQKTTEAVAVSISIQTKITDINDDCLEKVFLHLSFEDLMNIAHTNTKLIPAAELAFASKFGKKTIFTMGFDGYELTSIRTYGKFIYVHGLKYSLRVLRCFGHLISKLHIRHEHNHSDKIILYASRYGSESLTEIEFRFFHRDIFKHFEKPFSKAETVRFSHCFLKERSATLNAWFPKMCSLKLHHVVATPKRIEMYFPHLQRLEIKGETPTLKTENTLGMLRLNPQLRTLILDTNYTTRFIRCVHQNLQLLEHLEIRCSVRDFTDLDGEIIEFEKLERLDIDFGGYWSEEFPIIPILAEQLEEFTCHFQCMNTINNLIDFLVKHPSIIKLNIKWSWNMPNKFKVTSSKIAEALPLLQEAEFDHIYLSAEIVFSFTNKCKSLKIFRFNMRDQLEFDGLMGELDEQWESSKNGVYVTLKRKI